MNIGSPVQKPATVAVVGGGLAGMSAAAGAVTAGLDVTLFEARRSLGGRVGSFRDPVSGSTVDLCQHVAMRCCTNFVDFCRRIGVTDSFACQSRLHFVGPAGTRHVFSKTPFLPAPLHLAAGFRRLGYLKPPERRHIVRTLLALARLRPDSPGEQKTVGEWLRHRGESNSAIELFWSVVLVSALGETVDRASLAAARKVFVDGFLGNSQAYEMVVPQEPLGEIFDGRAGSWLADQGVDIHRSVKVRQIEGDQRQATAVVLADGIRRPFDFVVLAVPWWQVRRLLPDSICHVMASISGVDKIERSPISAVHLWLDRPLLGPANSALVGRLSQWVFRPAWMPSSSNDLEHYCQVVISASNELIGQRHRDVADHVCHDLEAVGLVESGARLLRHRVVTSRNAVFSVRPGIDLFRPAQATPIANLMLAGDWTDTGWPATMEGAVRSGYMAAEAILSRLGRLAPVLVPDLPRGLLARRLIAD